MKALNIAIFTDGFLPQTNGVATSVVNMAKGLAEKGHTVHIIAPKFKRNPSIKQKGVHIKRVSSIPAKIYEDFRLAPFLNPWVIKYLREQNIDVIHFHTPLIMGLEAITCSTLLGIPLVGTFHTFFADPQYLKHVKMNNRLFERLGWQVNNFFYNRCDLVTVPSPYSKKALKEMGCKRRIKVISNGIQMERFDNSRQATIKNKYNKRGPLLLFVGRIAHEKNILFLLDCFKEISRRVPECKLMLVGDGPQMQEVKEKRDALKIRGKVILMGRIQHKKLETSGIMGACNLFITASNTENQPMTLLEAQANGLVCVGSHKRGIPDLIRDGYNGHTFEPDNLQDCANKVVDLLSDEHTYNRFRANTLKGIQQHKLEAVIQQWEKTYNTLIRDKGRGRGRT